MDHLVFPLDHGHTGALDELAAAWLAQRNHLSWRIPVDRVALTGTWSDRYRADAIFPPGAAADHVLASTKGAPT